MVVVGELGLVFRGSYVSNSVFGIITCHTHTRTHTHTHTHTHTVLVILVFIHMQNTDHGFKEVINIQKTTQKFSKNVLCVQSHLHRAFAHPHPRTRTHVH